MSLARFLRNFQDLWAATWRLHVLVSSNLLKKFRSYGVYSSEVHYPPKFSFFSAPKQQNYTSDPKELVSYKMIRTSVSSWRVEWGSDFACCRGRTKKFYIIIKSKCIPALLYGLEACPLTKSDTRSLDFVINRFFNETFSYYWYKYCKRLPGIFFNLSPKLPHIGKRNWKISHKVEEV